MLRILISLLALGAWLAGPAGAQPTATTNVIMVVYDDLDAFGDLRPYGATGLRLGPPNGTPFSQALADEGALFDRFYANAAICSPSRIGFSTGLYPTQLGFSWVTGDTSRRGIPGTVPTLARLFSGMGYATGAFGKWHAGRNSADNAPLGVGFQTSAIDCTYTNIGVPSQDEITLGVDFGDQYENALFCDAPLQVLSDSGSTFATTYTVDKALAFMEDHLDSPPGHAPGPNATPFFAQIWLHAPHTPLTCPPGYTCPACDPNGPASSSTTCTNVDKRVFYEQMIAQAEEQLDRIRTDLVARGVWNDTVVIVTSDNGGVGAWQALNRPLRGAKGDLYEGGTRVPFLIRGPGINQGTVNETVVGHDVLLTLADYFGASLPGYAGSGVSFVDLLTGDGSGWMGEDRLIASELRPDVPQTSNPLYDPWLRYSLQKNVQGKKWKLVQNELYGGGVIPELYDLQAHPGEEMVYNKTWANPAVRNHLMDEHSNWRVMTNAFVPSVDYPVGTVTQAGDTFTFTPPGAGQEHGMLVLNEHPVLTVDNQDLSVSFTMTPAQVGAPARLVERRDSWSVMMLGNNRLHLQVREGAIWTGVTSKVPIVVGETYRVKAVVEAGRGVSLWVDDVLARVRNKINPVAETDFPVTVGRHVFGGAPFLGTLSDLVIHPISLRPEDLELGGAFVTGFEASDPQPIADTTRGTIVPLAEAAYRGTVGLRHVATGDDAYTLASPGVEMEAVVLNDVDDVAFQVSAWVRNRSVSGDEAVVSLYLFCLDANGSYTWDPRAFSFSHRLAIGEWRRITHQHQCPSGTDRVTFRLDNDLQGQTVDWDEIRLGRLSDARLNLDFEGETDGQAVQSIFASDGFNATTADAHTGTLSMRVPAGTVSAVHVLPYGGDNHFVTSLWARRDGAGTNNVRLWFYCYDTNDQVLSVDLGSCPTIPYPYCDPNPNNPCVVDQSCVRSLPGRLSTDWQQYSLSTSCPHGTAKTGIRVETNPTGADALIDDLTVSITSIPF